MSEPVIFKTQAFGGFQKEAVLSYIDGITADSQKTKEELEAKLAQLEEQVVVLKGQVPTDEQKAAQESLAKRCQELEELSKKTAAQLAEQQKAGESKDLELTKAKERLAKLQIDVENSAFKAKKYDEISMKVGSLVIESKQQAERIVEKAREDARRETKEKEEQVQKIYTEFEQFRQGVEHLRLELRDTLEMMDSQLEKLGLSLDAPEINKEEKHTYAPFHLRGDLK